MMHGVILAGGTGTRLGPVTRAVNKHLIPVYDKPMIYYPLTTLLLAGVTDLTFLSNSKSIAGFQDLLGDGTQWGIHITYVTQDEPTGIAGGLKIAVEESDGTLPTLAILGDNIFHGFGLGRQIAELNFSDKCQIWTQNVKDPESFGIAQTSPTGELIKIVEKPEDYIGNNAITGLYYFPPGLKSMLDNLEKSPRGEYEITEVLSRYLAMGLIQANKLNRGVYWLDAGTIENLVEVSQFVRAIQSRQGQLIGSPDEAAYRVGRISFDEFNNLVDALPNSNYREVLSQVIDEKLFY